MPTKLTMPKLGLTMTEGTIVEWRKKEGEHVEKGEIIYVLETEKISYEVEAPESGILAKIIAKEGDIVPVGGLVAYILQPGEELPEMPEVAARTVEVARKEAVATKVKETRELKASPVARRIAEENSIDLSTIVGTGPEGRIVREDVLRAMEEKKAAIQAATAKAPQKEKLIPLTTTRKTIAQRMTQSFQTAPHFWENVEVDVTELKKMHQELMPTIEKETGIRLTLTDLLIKIVVKAIEDNPEINATWTDEGIKILGDVNIGIAAAAPEGLIVPVMHKANEKSLKEITIARADLVTKAREGKLSLDEITGGTFTFNNVGMLGIAGVKSILNPPEAAILSTGTIMDKPTVVNGQIVIRPIMGMDITIDHRVLDGASCARFLMRVKELIEQPLLILS